MKYSLIRSRSMARASPEGSPSSYSTRNISLGTVARLFSISWALIHPCGSMTSRQHQVKIGSDLSRASSMTSWKVPIGFCHVLEATTISRTFTPREFSLSMA